MAAPAAAAAQAQKHNKRAARDAAAVKWPSANSIPPSSSIAAINEFGFFTIVVLTYRDYFTLEVRGKDSVASVKDQIHELKGIPFAYQRISFDEEVMSDYQTLSDCNVVSGSRIHLVECRPLDGHHAPRIQIHCSTLIPSVNSHYIINVLDVHGQQDELAMDLLLNVSALVNGCASNNFMLSSKQVETKAASGGSKISHSRMQALCFLRSYGAAGGYVGPHEGDKIVIKVQFGVGDSSQYLRSDSATFAIPITLQVKYHGLDRPDSLIKFAFSSTHLYEELKKQITANASVSVRQIKSITRMNVPILHNFEVAALKHYDILNVQLTQ